MNMMPQNPTQPVQPGQPVKKRNWLKIFGIFFVSLIIFVVAIVSLVFMLGSPALKAGELFLTQLSGSQVDKAYESASIQFKQAVSREHFDGFLQQFPVVTKVKTTSFNSFSIENNDFATLSGTITATDGQVSPISIELVNENDQWRVLNLDLNPPAPDTTEPASITDTGI